MKKAVAKGIVFTLTFFIALFIIGKIMNQGNADMTVDMRPARFPVIYMGLNGVRYNELHGYANEQNVAYMRDTITALSSGRSTEFYIETYGTGVASLHYTVRSVDGTRLIEDTPVTEWEEDHNTLIGSITVKELIEENEEYELTFFLRTLEEETICYYTRIVWNKNSHVEDELAYAYDFHEKTYDKEAVQELAKYMETNSLGDNTTLHRVDIHCSLGQLSWGNLSVKEVTAPVYDVTELSPETVGLKGHYIVYTMDEDRTRTYFYVEEYFRLRYTPDRMYLLDYVRNMDTILDEEADIYVNDKIMLGVADSDLPLIESTDGNVVAFVLQNRLYSYNNVTNKMTVVFGFYDEKNTDSRAIFNGHSIKVLDVDEGGNIYFAVYGYMNRGQHEGEVGILVYFYDSAFNTIEEMLYVPYEKTYRILEAEMSQLLYLNREGKLFFVLSDNLYQINLAEKTCTLILPDGRAAGLQISEDMCMAVWQRNGNLYHAEELMLMNLGTDDWVTVSAGPDDYILPLGFMGEDLVYGLAKKEDVAEEKTGKTVFPMYGIVIRNSNGEILKSYMQDACYIESIEIDGNQIVLNRIRQQEDGTYTSAAPDHIMSNTISEEGKNKLVPVITQNYGVYLQIQVGGEIDAKGIHVLTPKEVLYEDNRELQLGDATVKEFYYVYGPMGQTAVYDNPADAVSKAESISGLVWNDSGEYIWKKGIRSTRNQIMAIGAASATEEKGSLAVCLDTMLKYEGIVRNTAYLLSQGETALSILENNLPDAHVLELQNCSLDSVLYYVNQDIPVLALLRDGEAVLIVGFNEYNVVLMNPATGTLGKTGMNDTAKWLAENGNYFITYQR